MELNLLDLPKDIIYTIVSFFEVSNQFSSFIMTNKQINDYFKNIKILPNKILLHYHFSISNFDVYFKNFGWVSLTHEYVFSCSKRIEDIGIICYNKEFNIKELIGESKTIKTNKDFFFVEKNKIKELYIIVTTIQEVDVDNPWSGLTHNYNIYIDTTIPEKYEHILKVDLLKRK